MPSTLPRMLMENHFSSRAPHIHLFPQFHPQQFCLLSGLPTVMIVLFKGEFQGQFPN